MGKFELGSSSAFGDRRTHRADGSAWVKTGVAKIAAIGVDDVSIRCVGSGSEFVVGDEKEIRRRTWQDPRVFALIRQEVVDVG